MVALSVTLITLAIGARFELSFGWTAPVQLALVPTLFLLPPWLVPVTMAAGIVASRVPDVLRGEAAPGRLLIAPGNAWFTVGPAAVLAIAGGPGPAEAGALLLVAMLGAQIGTDFVISLLWQRITTHTSVADQLHEAFMVYVVDVALAPVGLLFALAIAASPWYLILMVPLFGVLAVFAAERRTRLVQLTELNGAYRGTALVLAEVVDADDAYTGRHTRDVVELSMAVADRLGLDDERRRNVEFGALLREAALVHDVGKIGVPDAILLKPMYLTRDEYDLVKRHAALGADIAAEVLSPDQVGWIRHHHERWDGGGYPDGLSGEEIPLGARIIAICDAYEAMVENRPWRTSKDSDAALTELRHCAGTQFDPRLVEIFCRRFFCEIGASRFAAPAASSS